MVRADGTVIGLVLAVLAAGPGCQIASPSRVDDRPVAGSYRVGAPDVLRIDAPRLVPLPTHQIAPEDSLYVLARGTLDGVPVNGLYTVGTGGAIDLGPTYGGLLPVVGKTASQVEKVLTERLAAVVEQPEVSVCVAHACATDAVGGEHLVRPDGTVRLGSYGVVPVAGKSPSQVEAAVVAHLRRFLHQPAVRVTVSAPNSQAVAGSRPRP